MKCKICASSMNYEFKAKIINKYEIEYFHCKNCGFLQTEEPYWLEEAYKNPINVSDTGLVKRNFELADITVTIAAVFFRKSIKVLDFAGGYGLFTRILRDIGIDCLWSDKYAKNLFARGFEYQGQDIDLVTAFEVFEHLTDPNYEIEEMLDMSQNLLFSTRLLPDPLPKPSEWWYYGLQHGQHVSFYSHQTLQYIAKKYNLFYNTDKKAVHLFSSKRINSLFFEYIVKFSKVGLLRVLKKKFASKTNEDHDYLCNISKI